MFLAYGLADRFGARRVWHCRFRAALAEHVRAGMRRFFFCSWSSCPSSARVPRPARPVPTCRPSAAGAAGFVDVRSVVADAIIDLAIDAEWVPAESLSAEDEIASACRSGSTCGRT